MPSHILVVDDDPHIREIVCFALANAGLTATSAADGANALEIAARETIDLIVLDIGLPEIDGLEVCRRIRKTSNTPILFLSSRSEEIDRILGIELGGDDYMVKPFSPRELVARIGAILRRSQGAPPPPQDGDNALRHGPLLIDPERFYVSFRGQEVQLTAIEMTMLKALAVKPGVVFDRNRIVATAYPRNIHISDRTIDSHIRNIRAKFSAAGCAEIIETVHGVGFRLAALDCMSNAPSKWRPSLGMVTAGMIGVVLVVAVGGFAIVRFNVAQPAGAEILTASMLALLAAFAIGIVFVRAISRPLRELVRRAELITHGDKTAIGPLERHGTRELAALSDAFMRMAQSLSDRTTYVRTFSRHVSHEMKTPLTAIRGAAELVLDGSETMTPADRRRFMGNIIADVERMTHLLDRLHEQARAETPSAAGVARLGEVVTALRARFDDLSISVSGDTDTEVAMTAENVLVVLDHLASNAREHGAKSLDLGIAPRGDVVVLHLQDDGAGINPGNRDRIFDPFFTTRRENGGTGMGLTIARAMLEAHGGVIEAVESATGARFALRLPSAPQSLHKNS